MNPKRALFVFLALLVAVLAGSVVATAVAGAESGKLAQADFTGDAAEVETFVRWYQEIDLTPEQESVRVAALQSLPAACCSNFSAATCCCECNLSRAIWGLSKHLIVNEKADAKTVRAAVERLYDALRPEGFSGDVCASGGCGKSMHAGGCGGMSAGNVVVD